MKQIYVNLPVKDLQKATEFYQALGFTKNEAFSDEKGSAMAWSESIIVMLITHEFYQKFIPGKQVIDGATTSGVLLSLSMDSKDEVQRFAETAKSNGGDYFKGDYSVPEDMMFGYEVLDPDGNQWEPVWMNPHFGDPQPTADE